VSPVITQLFGKAICSAEFGPSESSTVATNLTYSPCLKLKLAGFDTPAGEDKEITDGWLLTFGVTVGVAVGSGVFVAVGVLVGIGVAVAVFVAVGVLVGIGVAVAVFVAVGGIGVTVGTKVAVGTKVGVDVEVGGGIGVLVAGTGVGVFVGGTGIGVAVGAGFTERLTVPVRELLCESVAFSDINTPPGWLGVYVIKYTPLDTMVFTAPNGILTSSIDNEESSGSLKANRTVNDTPTFPSFHA